uniref:Uncharacterized protein n=1 Tax=Arundo donax TaxID=35708 RepID=A0A0A9BCJ9_ARUDO
MLWMVKIEVLTDQKSE